MKVFVIAMANEAECVLSRMTDKNESIICGKRVISGALFDKKTAVVICGVGKVNAACGAQLAIDKLHADCIINLGVAGGLNGGVELAKTYSIACAVQYDFDLTQLNGTKIGTLDECKENYLPLSASGKFPQKRLATGDRFNDSPEDYALLTGVLKADIRDMEGGAIAQVCMHAGVECREYKTISDLAGSGSTTEQYLKNLTLCFDEIERQLKNIFD